MSLEEKQDMMKSMNMQQENGWKKGTDMNQGKDV
jgi:hypothetical protein